MAQLLSHLNLLGRALDVPLLGLTVLVAELCPAVQVTALQVGRVLHVGQDGITLAPLHSLLAHVGTPGDGVAMIDGIVHNLKHFAHGHVLVVVPQPVVGHLKYEGLVERVMCERRNADVIVHLDGQRSSIALRRVGLALPSECLGQLAHIGVEDTLETVNPRGSEFLKLALVNHIGISLKVGGKL